MEDKKIKVFFISNAKGEFITRDIRLLEKHFQVKTLHFKGLRSLHQSLIRIIRGVKWADVTFSGFADTHALITTHYSRKYRRRSIVRIGGYEVANIKEFKYGLNRSFIYPKIVRRIFKNTDIVITVSSHLKEEAISNLDVDPGKITVVPNGFDSSLFLPHGQKQNMVLTAAICPSMNTVRLKGIDTLLEAAKMLPDVPFTVIGIYSELQKDLKKNCPSNVRLIGPLPQKDILPYYQSAKVYCQLSLREGHPNALSEAMLCECIPVISDAPGNTFAAGNIGFEVPYSDPEKTAVAIKNALDSKSGSQARISIMGRFPLQKRELSLQKIISDLYTNSY